MSKGFINFEGQVCLVTGAGSPTGIGFSTAKILSSLGAKVALVATTDRIQERAAELNAAGGEAKGYVANLMDRRQVAEIVKNVIADFGKVDVLVNNAGMTQVGEEEDFTELIDVSYESWDTSIARNLTLTFNVTKQLLPYMVEQKYGRIVNVSSVTGPIVSNPGEAAYSAAKAGIIGSIPTPSGIGKVVIATGGTSDIPVAEEAALTAEVLGSRVVRLYDVGVSGVHRLLAHMDLIMGASVIIAIAGMEGALASVVGGLADCPVIAVPTSVGYGASFGGVSALLSMLNSCASGVSVVNIDNGFGAGYLANMINHMEVRK